MPFILGQMILGSSDKIDITLEEYESLKRASENILQAVSLEEKLDILLGNFVELETDLLAAATRDAVYVNLDYLAMRTEANFTVRRRLLNLLAAARAYIDHGVHDLKRIVDRQGQPSVDFSKRFEKYTNDQYDTVFGYRLMEALRNHIQHRGIPIYTSYDKRMVRVRGEHVLAYHVQAKLQVSEVLSDKKFKHDVLVELQAKGDMVDVTPFVRAYVEALGVIQRKVRSDIDRIVSNSEMMIRDAIDRYVTKIGKDGKVALAAIEMNEDDTMKGVPTYLLETNIKYLAMLSKKNSLLEGMTQRFAVGRGL